MKTNIFKKAYAWLTSTAAKVRGAIAASPIWKEYNYLAFSFLIPAIVVLLIYVAKGLHPIADGCVLVLDLNGQYVWFFEALRNFVRGDAELLYSFSRALGGEFLGIYAYYLASPLSFLVSLFPTERMLEALLVLFMIKAGLCGTTFGYYMHKSMKKPNKLSIIIFSCCYALSAYAIVQQHNTMWIDAVMWLPLITLGIENIIKYGKFKLYVVSLAVAVFSNFYIGYMLCFYCAIYFFIYYFAHAEEYRNNPLREKWHFLRSLYRIVGYSLLSLGIAAVIILGAYYSLNFGKTTFSNPNWEFALKFDLMDFLFKLLPGSYDTVRPEGLPFVYCGVLTLLLIPSYFLSKKYSMREKIFAALFLLVIYASFCINVVDLVWHGFQKPNWLNYRYSFMFSFALCVMACRAFADFENINLKVTMGTGGLIALFCIILQKYAEEDTYLTPNDFTCIYFSLIMVFAYVAVLAILRKSLNQRVASFGLVCVLIVELFLSGLWGLNDLGADVGYSRYSYYNDFLKRTRPIVEQVQEADDSFYRMEKTFHRMTNDNMALAMRGLSGSTSTLNKETIRFLNSMGYSSKAHWSKYLGGNPVSDSLLGLKYIISPDTLYADYYEEFKTDPLNGYTAYYNPYALSIAYGVSEDLLDFELGFVEDISDDESVTDKKGSKITKAIEAFKSLMNEWLNIEENASDVYENGYDDPFTRLNAMLTAMLGEEETVAVFVPVEHTFTKSGLLQGSYAGNEYGYRAEVPGMKGYLSFVTDNLPTDAEIFFYAPTDYPREVNLELSVNDGEYKDIGTFHGNETSRIISLGKQEAESILALKISLIGSDYYVKRNEPCFWYIDWVAFEDVMARLAQDQFVIEEYTEHSFEGTFVASRANELVMTTIPYDNGWEVWVDGEKVAIQKALGALIAFHVGGDAGEEHDIRIVYNPKTINVGIIISLSSIAVFVLLIVLDKKFHFGCKKRADVDYDEIDAEDAEDAEGDDAALQEASNNDISPPQQP